MSEDKAVSDTMMRDGEDEEGEEEEMMEEEHETMGDGEIDRLSMRVLAMPDDKSVHEEYIAAMKKALESCSKSAMPGLVEQLRKERQDFISKWPVKYEFWEDWLVDEFRAADRASIDERKRLCKLCVDAFAQTYAVDVLLLSCDLVSEFGSEEEIVSTFEDAVELCGVHVAEATKIWDAYRTYVEKHPGVLSQEEHGKKVLALFKRQLGNPLIGMDKTFAHFTVWSDDLKLKESECKDIECLFEQTSKLLASRAEFENTLKRSAAVAEWQRYITFEQSQQPLCPERVASLYERAIASCVDTPECPRMWVSYSSFVAGHMSQCVRLVDMNSPMCVFVRAVCYCSTTDAADAQCYLSLLQDCEQEGYDCDIDSVITMLLSGLMAMTSQDQALQLVNGTIDWYVRKYRALNCADSCKESLIENVKTMRDCISDLFGKKNCGATNSALKEHIAKLQYVVFKDPVEGKKLYEQVLRSCPQDASKWLKYAELERYCGGGIDSCRAIFLRALSSVSVDGLQSVIASWVELERLSGTLNQFNYAWQQCYARMYTVQQMMQQQQAQQQTQPQAGKRKRKEPEKSKGEKDDEHEESEKETTIHEEPKKRMRLDMDGIMRGEGEPVSSVFSKPTLQQRLERSVHVTGLPRTTSQEEVRTFFQSFGDIIAVRLGKTPKGTLRGFGFVEFSEKSSAERAIAQHHGVIGGREITIEECEEKKENGSKESSASSQLFISNISFMVTEDELKQLFAPRTVLSLKIHRTADGKSKGFGFVKFSTAAEAEDALKVLNKHVIHDRELKLQHFAQNRHPDQQQQTATSSQPNPVKKAPVTFAAPRALALKHKK